MQLPFLLYAPPAPHLAAGLSCTNHQHQPPTTTMPRQRLLPAAAAAAARGEPGAQARSVRVIHTPQLKSSTVAVDGFIIFLHAKIGMSSLTLVDLTCILCLGRPQGQGVCAYGTATGPKVSYNNLSSSFRQQVLTLQIEMLPLPLPPLVLLWAPPSKSNSTLRSEANSD